MKYSEKYLTCDINGIIIMTYVKIINSREKHAHQLDHFAFEAAPVQQSSCIGVGRALWCFQAPSLSLRARSTTNAVSVAGAGAEGRLHRQAATEPGSTSQRARQLHQPLHKRFDHASPRAFSSQKTWLNSNPTKRLNWNTVMIAWRNVSFASFMKVCFHSINAVLTSRLPSLSK